MPDSALNWKQVVLTATITGVFTVLAGLATYYFTTRAPKLEYSLVQGPPLTSGDQSKRIYVLDVRNTGKKEVEEVRVQVVAPKALLADYAIRASPGLQLEQHADSSELAASIPVLNPEDSLAISFLLAEAPGRGNPIIAVRGKGIRGEERLQGTRWPFRLLALWPIVLVATLSSLASLSPIVLRFIRVPGGLLSADSRAETLAYVLGAAGFSYEASSILFRRADPTYRSTADHLMNLAENQPEVRQRSVIALECILLSPHINRESRVLVERAAKALGVDDAKIQRLRNEAAQNESPADFRAAVDAHVKTFARIDRDIRTVL